MGKRLLDCANLASSSPNTSCNLALLALFAADIDDADAGDGIVVVVDVRMVGCWMWSSDWCCFWLMRCNLRPVSGTLAAANEINGICGTGGVVGGGGGLLACRVDFFIVDDVEFGCGGVGI